MQGGVALARRASTPLLGVLLAVVTWRDIYLSPIPGLDPSWHAALHMAARDRVPFEDLVFTFGPLGFLTQPVAYYGSTGLLSGLYVLGLQIALCAALVSVLRRSMPLALAAVLTFVLAGAARELKAAEVVVVVAVLVAFGLLRGDHSPRTERILVVVAGVTAGTHLLVKFNTGVIVALVAAVTVWFVGRRTWRSEALFASAAAASLLAGWLVTGNSPGDLVPFLDRSLEVASGYSETMGIELGGRGIFYPLAAAATGVVVALAWIGSRGWSVDRRLGLALIGAVWLYAALKHGFVRHDEHDIVFFGEALLIGAGFAAAAASPGRSGDGGARRGRWLPPVGAVVLLAFYLLATEVDVGDFLNPVPALERAGGDALTVVSSSRRARAVEEGRAELRRRYGLEPATVAELEGRTVHIRPWEAAVAWAYPEIGWRPVPVFQEYSAYTAGLDRLNATFLNGPSAPDRILTEPETVDFRNPDWDSPAAVVAVLCNYREVASQARWQVLGRVDHRCGAEEPLGEVEVRVGDVVAVPDTGGRDVLVVARVRGLDDAPLYGLRSALWRIPPVHLTLDGARRYRLVPGTAANGLVVRAPTAVLGFSEPFAPGSATSLTVEHGGGPGLGSSLTVEFVAVPVLN